MKYMDWNNMHGNLEALYVLDNALTDPAKDYLRLIRKSETDTKVGYIVDNGAGDTLHVIFTEDAVVIKGFAHENSLNQFAAEKWDRNIIDNMYKGLDLKLLRLFSKKERDYSTFVIWYDGTLHQNPVRGNDGGRWLLSYAFDTYERFKEFVKDYYSKNFNDNLLKKLYKNNMLSDVELAELIK